MIEVSAVHGYFPRQNLYGPVCFKLSNEFLLDKSLPNICITKDNESDFNIALLKTRICNNCFCKANYFNQVSVDELEKLFKP